MAKVSFDDISKDYSRSQYNPMSIDVTMRNNKGLDSIRDRVNTNIYNPIDHDFNEIAAENQSTAEKWWNGAVKATYTASMTALDPFVSLTYGIGESLVKGLDRGDYEFADIYNNSISQASDSFGQTLQELMPNLYTKAEQDLGVLEQMGSANFWADKFLNGAGFMAGAYLSMLVGNGVGVSKAAGKLGKLFSTQNKALTATAEAMEVSAASKGILGVTNATATKALEKGLYSAVSAWGESSQEARGVINQIKETLTQQKLQEKGLQDESQLSNEDRADIQSKANSGGNVDFAINLPLTGFVNSLVMRNMFKGLDSQVKAAVKGDLKLSERIIEEKGKLALEKTSKLGIAGRYASKPAEEAAQEFAQFITETGTVNAYTDKKNKGKNALDTFITSTAYGLQQTFGTKAGLESGLLGAILGGGFGSVQTHRDIKNENKDFQTIVDAVNAHNSTDTFKTYYKEAVNALNKISEMKKAATRKDRYLFNTLKDEVTTNYFLSRYKAGMKDKLDTEIKQIEELGDAEFKKLFDIDENISEDELKRFRQDQMQNFKDKAKSSETIYNNIQRAFASEHDSIKDEFFKLSAGVDNADTRIQELKTKFANITNGVEYSNLIEAAEKVSNNKESLDELVDKYNKGHESYSELLTDKQKKAREVGGEIDENDQELKDKRNEITDLQTQISIITGSFNDAVHTFKELKPEEREEARELLDDILKLSNHKADTIREYNRLTENPEAKGKFLVDEFFDDYFKPAIPPTPEELKEAFIKHLEDLKKQNPHLANAIDDAAENLLIEFDESIKGEKDKQDSVDTQVAAGELTVDDFLFENGKNTLTEEENKELLASSAKDKVAQQTKKKTTAELIAEAKQKATEKANNRTDIEEINFILDFFKDRQAWKENTINKAIEKLNSADVDWADIYKEAEGYTDNDPRNYHVTYGSKKRGGSTVGQGIAIANMHKARLITDEEIERAYSEDLFSDVSKLINKGVNRIHYITDNNSLPEDVVRTLEVLARPDMSMLDIIRLTDNIIKDSEIQPATDVNILKTITTIDAIVSKFNIKGEKSTWNKENYAEGEKLIKALIGLTGIEPRDILAQDSNTTVKDTIITEVINEEDPDTIEEEKGTWIPPKKNNSITASGSFYKNSGLNRDNNGEATMEDSIGAAYQKFINGQTTYDAINDVDEGNLIFNVEVLHGQSTSSISSFSQEEYEQLAKALNITIKEVKEIGQTDIRLGLTYKQKEVGITFLHDLRYVNKNNMGFESQVRDGITLEEAIFNERVKFLSYRKSVIDLAAKGKTFIQLESLGEGFPNIRKDFNNLPLYSPVEEIFGTSLDKLPIGMAKGVNHELVIKGKKTGHIVKSLGAVYIMVKSFGGQFKAVPLKVRRINSKEADTLQMLVIDAMTGRTGLKESQLMYSIATLVGKKRIEIAEDKQSVNIIAEGKVVEVFSMQDILDDKMNEKLMTFPIQVSYNGLMQNKPITIRYYDVVSHGFKEQVYTSYTEYLTKGKILETALTKNSNYRIVQPTVTLGEPKSEAEIKPIITKESEINLTDVNNINATDKTIKSKVGEVGNSVGGDKSALGDVKFTKEGGNKVVDNKGEPIIVYHATNNEFEGNEFRSSTKGSWGEGVYFGDTENLAKSVIYNQDANVIKANILLKNPLIVNEEQYNNLIKEYGVEGSINRYLMMNGFDGAIRTNYRGGAEYFVLDPKQIKILPKPESRLKEQPTQDVSVGGGKSAFTPTQKENIANLKQSDSRWNKYTDEDIQRFIDSVFPDSKVKDIVYHGTDKKFDNFNKNFINQSFENLIYFFKNRLNALNWKGKTPYTVNKSTLLNNINNLRTSINEASIEDNLLYALTQHFKVNSIDELKNKIDIVEFEKINNFLNQTGLKSIDLYSIYQNNIEEYRDIVKNTLNNLSENIEIDNNRVIFAIIEVNNPLVLNDSYDYYLGTEKGKEFKRKVNNEIANKDSLIVKEVREYEDDEIKNIDTQYAVKESEQIYILNSDQAISDMDKFVAKPLLKKQPIQSKVESPVVKKTIIPNVKVPVLTTVKVNLSKLNITELENVVEQLAVKFEEVRGRELNKQPTLISSKQVKADIRTVKQYIKELSQEDSNLNPNIVFRSNQKEKGTYLVEDIEKGKEWFNKRFESDISLVTYNKLLRVGQSNAHGYFESALDKLGGTVMLWDNAEEGTLYHEAFHAVWRIYLTNKERENILKDLSVKHPNKSNLELEEILAENFREYILNDGETNDSKKVKTFFGQLLEILKTFWDVVTGKRKNNLTVGELFKRIDAGYYKEAIPTGETMAYFAPKVYSLKNASNLTPKQLTDVIDMIDMQLHKFVFDPANKVSFIELSRKESGLEKLGNFYNRYFEFLEKHRIEKVKTGNIRTASNLQKLITNKEDIVKAHLYHLRTFKIKVDLNEGESIITEGNTFDFREGVEIDMKDNIDAEIKFFLNIIPKFKEDKEGNFIEEKNEYGINKKGNWQGTYHFLQKKLANITSFDEALQRMEGLKATRPEIGYILNNIKKYPMGFRISFVQAFYQQKNNYLLHLINPNTGEIYKINPETNTVEDSIVTEWFTNFKLKDFVVEDGLGNLIINKDRLQPILNDFLKIKNKKAVVKKNVLVQPFKEMVALGEKVGIVFTPKALTKLNTNDKAIIYENIYYVLDTLSKVREYNRALELFGDQKKNLLALANYESDSRPDTQSSSHLNPEGKPVHGYSLSTALNDMIQKLNKGDLQELDTKLFSKNSWYLQQIKEGADIKLLITEGLKVDEGGKEGTLFRDLNLGDYSAVRISSILDGVETSDKDGEGKGVFAIFQAGDKSTAYSIGGFQLLLSSGQVVDLKTASGLEITEEDIANNKALAKSQSEAQKQIADIFYKYFQDELLKVVQAKLHVGILDINSVEMLALRKELGEEAFSLLSAKVLPKEKWVIPYHTLDGVTPNGTALELGVFKGIIKDSNVDGSAALYHYLSKGNFIINSNKLKVLKDCIFSYIQAETNRNLDLLTKNKVVIKDKNNDLTGNGLHKPTLDKYNGNVKAMIYHATLNDLISKIEFSKLFVGDLAFYKDLFKRMQSFQATGKVCLDSEAIRSYIQHEIYDASPNTKNWVVGSDAKVLFINDLIRNESNDESIKELVLSMDSIFGKAGFHPDIITAIKNVFNNIKSSDGTTWSNIETFREFHERIGDWNDLQTQIYNKIVREEEITNKEYVQLIMTKPTKLVATGKENSDNGLNTPLYLKTAVAPPLIPQFVKDTELKKMVEAMYKAKANYIVALSSSKDATVGLTNAFRPNGSFDDTIDYSKNIVNLPWNGFRENLQIDAAKEQKDTLVVTQARALIWTAVFDGGEVANKTAKLSIGNKEYGHKEAFDVFNKAHAILTKRAAKTLSDKFGIKIDGDKFKITNLEGVIALLEEELDDIPQNAKEQLEVITDKNGNKRLKLPFDVTTLGNKIQNKLNNLVTERIIKQKINGSNNVLVSNAGHYSVDNGGIIRGDLRAYIDTKGGLVLQVKLPHHFKELLGKNVNLADINPKLLRMIGIRVPTQGLNSIHRLEVVEFLPEELGDVIMLPSVIVTISGADFDIDKLFIFKYNSLQDETERLFKSDEVRKKLKAYIDSGDYLNYWNSRASYVNEEGETVTNTNAARNVKMLEINAQTILDEYENLTEEQLKRIHQAAYSIKEQNKLNKKEEKELVEVETLDDIYSNADDKLLMSTVKKILSVYAKEFKELQEAKTTYIKDYLEPDMEKPLEELTKKELQNVILDVFHGLLGNSDNEALQIVPNGADNLKELRNEIAKNKLTKEEFDYKYSEVNGKIKHKELTYTQYIQFIENAEAFITFAGGKVGVGQTAVHNVHHVLAQIYNLRIVKEAFKGIKIPTNKDAEGNISLAKIKALDGSYISEELSQLLTAFVDVAKDPFIFDLNAISFTTNTIIMMVRMGTPIDYVFYFMNQPIIKDYAEEITINESEIVQKNRNLGNGIYRDKNQIQKYLQGKYSSNSDIETNSLLHVKEYSLEELKLAQRIAKDTRSVDANTLGQYNTMQLNILEYFVKLQELSKELQIIVRASDTPSKGVPKEMWLVENKLELIEQASKNPNFLGVNDIVNYEYIMGKVEKENPNFAESFTKHGLVNTVNWFGEDIFLQQNKIFKSIFRELLKKEVTDDDSIYDIRKQITEEKIAKKIRQYMFFSVVAYNNKQADDIESMFITKYDVPEKRLDYGFNLSHLLNILHDENNKEKAIVTGAKYSGEHAIVGKYIADLDSASVYTDIKTLDKHYEGGKLQFLRDLGYKDEKTFINNASPYIVAFYKSENSGTLSVSNVKSIKQAPYAKNKKGLYQVSLAGILQKIKSDPDNQLKDNLLISLLSPELAVQADKTDLIKFNNKVGDPELKDNLTKAWEDGLEDDSPLLFNGKETSYTVSDFFNDLAMYSMYQSGMNDNPFAIFRMIPSFKYIELVHELQEGVNWYNNEAINYKDTITNEVSSNIVSDNTVIQSILLKQVTEINYPFVKADGTIKNISGAGILVSSDNSLSKNKFLKVEHKVKIVRKGRRKNREWRFFQRLGTNLDGDVIFVRLPLKGEKNKLVEIGIDTSKSILDTNNTGLPTGYKEYVEELLDRLSEDVKVPELDVFVEVEEVETVTNTDANKLENVKGIEKFDVDKYNIWKEAEGNPLESEEWNRDFYKKCILGGGGIV